MDEAQTRERVTRWIDESKETLALLPALLESGQRLGAKSHEEAERLRRELAELRKEVADLRKDKDDSRKESGDLQKEITDLHKEIEDLKKQNEVLQGEKDEAAQAFARLLDTVQSTNQIAQKLGVTKSPFARHGKEPASAPNPTPHD